MVIMYSVTVSGSVLMTFHNQNILIACSEKKDRLQFFNYFDGLNADKIFTATDIEQMGTMLANEAVFSVLVFEISQQWVKNNNQIIKLKEQYPELKLVGLVSPQVELNHQQFLEVREYLAHLVFSPIMQHELVAKSIAASAIVNQPKENLSEDGLDTFLSEYFDPSGFPQLLIDVNTHEIKYTNKSLHNKFSIERPALIGQVWYEIISVKPGKEVVELKSELIETGQIVEHVQVNLNGSNKAIELRMCYASIGDHSYYLAEALDLTEQVFQRKFLKSLERVTTLDFENIKHKEHMQTLLKWSKFDFCFIVRKNSAGEFNQIVWDCSLNNYAQKFIAGKHD